MDTDNLVSFEEEIEEVENQEGFKQYSFEQEIEDLFRLHYVTKTYDHIIQYQKDAWRLFEPSKFIYAYFAFNSYYNFDWENSLKEKKLCGYPEDVDKTEGYRYKAMIDFIFPKLDDSDRECFFKIIRGKMTEEKLIEMISMITPDHRISPSEREDFKKAFKEMLTKKEIKIGKLKHVIVRFIYMVRNNIFHGTKNTIEMSEIFQRKRLEIYSNIIIALNEMLFRVLARFTAFKPFQKYDLKS